MLNIINMALKEYVIYYLNIIPIIYFLINYQLFAPHITYILVKHYLTNNLNNNNIDNNKKK